MKRFLLFVTVLALTAYRCSGELIILYLNYPTNSIYEDSTAIYYSLINNAELNICNNDNAGAIDKYKEAFKYSGSPFPKDIFNYILLNVYEENFSEAFKYAENLVKLGAELKFFDQIPLNKMKSDEIAWGKFCEDFPKLRTFYLNNINFGLRQELNDLLEADQAIYQTKLRRQSNIVGADSICSRFYQICTEIGYPNHDLIGLSIKNDTLFHHDLTEIIIVHLLLSNHINSKAIVELLFDAVLKNNLEPDLAIRWMDIYHSYQFYGTHNITYWGKDIYLRIPHFEFWNYDFYNLNRKRIYACSFEESLQKSIFRFNHPDSKFYFGYFRIIPEASKQPEKQKNRKKINFEDYLISDFPNLFNNPVILNNEFVNDSIKAYHQYINLAELSICHYDYNKSNKLYRKAFSYNSNPFPKDLVNCILVNIYDKDFKSAIKYCEELLKTGVKPTFFNQIPFNELKKRTKLWKKFTEKIPDLETNLGKHINPSLVNEISGLYESFKESIVYGKSSSENKEIEIFQSIIKENGYPGHKSIGVLTYNDTIISESTHILPIFYQTHNDPKVFNDLTPLLLKEVYAGNLHPTEFLNIVKFTYNEDVIFGTPLFCIDYQDNLYLKNTHHEKFSECSHIFHQNRETSLNCSVHDEIKKKLFLEKNRNLKFDFYIPETYRIEFFLAPILQTSLYTKINPNDH